MQCRCHCSYRLPGVWVCGSGFANLGLIQVVRGGAAAPLAQLLAAIEPAVAAAAGLPPWSLVSAGADAPALGRLRFAPTLVRFVLLVRGGATAWPGLREHAGFREDAACWVVVQWAVM